MRAKPNQGSPSAPGGTFLDTAYGGSLAFTRCFHGPKTAAFP
ncbi:MAG: hypothetical protein BWZ02_02740 [Lentisphaerae bacterium ADurb.BinA184]|nr:MAG: hypothetical protein BWZ02_02740 [Lentisphaerae bacterium ADurb.BinA184]